MRAFPAGLVAIAFAGALALSSCATDQPRRQATGWTELGNSWAELGSWDKAGDAWSRALALDPGQAIAGYNLARALAEAGKYDESIDRSDDYLESDPDNAAVMSIKAYALHKAGRDGEAIAVYERVVSLNAGDSASLFNLAVLLDAAERRVEALERLDAILALKPDDSAASLRKGLILADDGKPEEALPLIERYAAAFPDSAEGKRALASAQERCGRFAEAIESYAAMVAKDAADARSWFALAKLKLTVAADESGGIEALNKAVAGGFKDGKLALALMATKDLVAEEKVRAILDAAGLLGKGAIGTDSEAASGESATTPVTLPGTAPGATDVIGTTP